MHDVAKSATAPVRRASMMKRILISVMWVTGAIGLILGLKAIGIPIMKLVGIVLIVGLIAFGLAAFRRFKRGRPASGAILSVVAVVCLLFGIKALQFGKMMSMPRTMPPTVVMSATVKQEDWPPVLSAVGSISPTQGAVVATELGGVVAEVKFQNGGEAKKGDVLVSLDTSSENAQLRAAEADLELARANLQRTRDLAARKVVSKSELDTAESAFGQKQGMVDNMRSLIAKKQIRAPFDGQLGIRQVNIGQSIDARQPIVALTALDPVFVDFALPQQELSKLAQGLEVHVRTDAVPGREFKGKLTAINSMVDAVTRNVSVQATLDNADHALRPGMFAKVDVVLPEKEKTLVVPGSAISYAPYGNSVFVIENQKDPHSGKQSQVIKQAFVRLGEARGDFIAIKEGLKAGDTVVSAGVFKLRSGMPVAINNDLAPQPQLNPKPPDT